MITSHYNEQSNSFHRHFKRDKTKYSKSDDFAVFLGLNVMLQLCFRHKRLKKWVRAQSNGKTNR